MATTILKTFSLYNSHTGETNLIYEKYSRLFPSHLILEGGKRVDAVRLMLSYLPNVSSKL